MKNLFLALVVIIASGCADRPFEQANTVYNDTFLIKKNDRTKVRVHRISQVSGSGLGESCPLVLKVDDIETAGLQQNQFVDLYLGRGKHSLSVRFKCAITEWRKSVEINVGESPKEFKVEMGSVGQYRIIESN